MTMLLEIMKWMWDHPRLTGLGLITVLFLTFGKITQGKNDKIDDLRDQRDALGQILADERKFNQLTIEVLERKDVNDKSRSEFAVESARAIAEGKATGNGPAAPVLLDTAHRLQSRQKTYR